MAECLDESAAPLIPAKPQGSGSDGSRCHPSGADGRAAVGWRAVPIVFQRLKDTLTVQ